MAWIAFSVSWNIASEVASIFIEDALKLSDITADTITTIPTINAINTNANKSSTSAIRSTDLLSF